MGLVLSTVDKHSGDESAPLVPGGKRVKAEKSSVIAEMVAVPGLNWGPAAYE
jgi:hypothetical protein